jgi:hypothetical protein
MNGSLLAPVAALLSVLLWLAARRRPGPLLSATRAQALAESAAALNRAQIALVQQLATQDVSTPAAVPLPPLPRPGDGRQRQALLTQLRSQLAGDQPQRLAAIQLAGRWGDRVALPLLRIGLRDVDLAVQAEAARAIARFRSPGGVHGVRATQLPLPRNVARTR